jgi:tetratricopeptide (TPR) repeat protein
MFRSPCFSLLFGLIVVSCSAQSLSQSPSSPPARSGTTVEPSPAAANPLGDARALYRKGDFDGAIAKYEDFERDHLRSPDGYAGMARVYLKQKKVEEAEQAVQQGLAQSDAPRMHVAQAEVWFRQGKIVEAETEWAKVINAGHPEARAYLGLARVRRAIAMYKTAKRLIDKAHELDPDDPDIDEAWVETLSRAEHIKYLEASLAGGNNWDADRRANTAIYLQYLKERFKQNRNPCRLVSRINATEAPLVRLLQDPQHMRGYGLSVFLNGHKSLLMLDTGASGILITRSIAQHAGISKIVEVKVGGIGDKGRKEAFVGVADSIKVGNLEFQNCPVEVIERGSIVGEDGLIGADVFSKFLVDLDFPNEKLKLSELPKRPGEPDEKLALSDSHEDSDEPDSSDSKETDAKAADPKLADAKTPSVGPQDRYIAPEMQNYTRVFRFGHFLLTPTKIGDVPYKLFLLDTGAVTNSISPAAAREVTKVEGDSHMTIKGISGSVDKVYTADRAVLQFGHLRQENQELTAFDTKHISDAAGTEISGFLGFIMLRILDIKIDYRDALVDFQYDAKRFGR